MRQFRSHTQTFPPWIYGYVFHRYGCYHERFQGIKPAALGLSVNLGAVKCWRTHTTRCFAPSPLRDRSPPVCPPTRTFPASRTIPFHTGKRHRNALYYFFSLPSSRLAWAFPSWERPIPRQTPQSPGAPASAAAGGARRLDRA